MQKLDGTDVHFKMVPIPAGTFTMGSPENEPGRGKGEGPQHDVKVDAFYMEEHEVAWAEYNLFLNNYARLASTRPVEVPKDKLADAVTFPTPIYDVECGSRTPTDGRKDGAIPCRHRLPIRRSAVHQMA